MNLTFFDIETYQEFFCFCAICYDSETHKELWRKSTISSPKGIVDGSNVADVMDAFERSDYIISYNGNKEGYDVITGSDGLEAVRGLLHVRDEGLEQRRYAAFPELVDEPLGVLRAGKLFFENSLV